MKNICSQCLSAFEIDEADLAFYDRISPVIDGKKQSIPPPTLCPECRRQRRLAWRNEKRLYHRTCDLTGQRILSIYSSDKPFKLYEQSVWHSDRWDPLSYGRPYDPSRSFFEQWGEISRDVPMPSMNLRFQNENSDYTNLSARNKNCYMIFASNDNEDCSYSTFIHRSRRLIDCYFTFDSENCYECIDCTSGYNLLFSEHCRDCRDSALLFSCQGCSNCIGCVNLVKKEYHVFNQSVSRQEFKEARRAILQHRTSRTAAAKKLEELRLSLAHKYMSGFGNENVTGDNILFSKNVFDSYDITYSEDLRYCVWFHKAKNCYDCYGWGLPGELALECHLVGNGFYNVLFSESCANDVSNLLYCRYCENGSKNLFGCIGLQHKEYCVLNKQYTKEEYEELVPRIIEKMRIDGEFGEFFPASLSPYGYNETVAQEYYPLDRDAVLGKGWQWRDIEESPPVVDRIIDAAEVPDEIGVIPDDITQWAIRCEATGRPFRIAAHELAFYREHGLPLPRRAFDQRHADRIARRNHRKLWNRTCANCHKPIATSYAPERPEKVVCEECYLKEVY